MSKKPADLNEMLQQIILEEEGGKDAKTIDEEVVALGNTLPDYNISTPYGQKMVNWFFNSIFLHF